MILAVSADPVAQETLQNYVARDETRRVYENLFALAALGLHDAFLDALVQADGSLNSARVGLPTMVWSGQNRPMRADPRFMQLMETEGITELWRELGPPPGCRAEGDSFSCGHGY